MTADDLTQYVGANADDSAFVTSCWAEAEALVYRHIRFTGSFVGFAVPQSIVRRATLDVGSELYHRRNAPSGIAQFATAGDASPVRLARDPMTSVYPMLAPWLGAGVA